MAHCRITFDSLELFEDEEWGSTHMAVYGVVTAGGNQIASFQWNNLGHEVDEVATYNLGTDPGHPNVIDFDLTGPATLTINAYTHDDHAWPSAGDHENDLGTLTRTFDPAAPASLGSTLLGPSNTDQNDAGYDVRVNLETIAEAAAADVRITLNNLVLYEDEEWGSTHMAIYVHAQAPAQNGVDAIDREIFRWNNFGNEVDEVASYALDNGSAQNVIHLRVGGPTQIWVEGYADDDQDWPSSGNSENSLGLATITIDPNNPGTLGNRVMGPTTTDDDDQGYEINAVIEKLPDTPGAPDLAITGVEVTQAIQRFASATGTPNSAPLVRHKATMVRVYLDSGVDPGAPGGGVVPNVTGTLTLTGSSNITLNVQNFSAKPASQVSRGVLTDTLNFVLPGDVCDGASTITVSASVPGSTAAPVQLNVNFQPTVARNILMLRIGTPSVAPDNQATYVTAVNALTTIYPIATDPSEGIVYWIDPGNETYITTRNLNKKNSDGSEDLSDMDDLLEDIEDIQEDGEDWQKLYGLVPAGVPMNRVGNSTENQAYGYAGLTGSVAHELGHLYGLDHAPCPSTGGPGVKPDNTDDDFVPSDGTCGDVGVDVMNNQVFSASSGDFMSYCAPSWISVYHWQKLFNKFQEQ